MKNLDGVYTLKDRAKLKCMAISVTVLVEFVGVVSPRSSLVYS
jgi:hypothetical protein